MRSLRGMSHARLRLSALAVGILAPLALLGALSAAQPHFAPRQTASAKPETAGQSKKFKNIKVLRDLPADQLIPVMHKWNTDLGVKCDFCHVIGPDHTGFEKDDMPTKLTARKMVLLTRDLNMHQKSIDKKATCYMCHHGHQEPETTAPAQ